MKVAVVVIAVVSTLAVASSATAKPSGGTTLKPTPTAIRYWKAHLVGFARRDAWWRGYLSNGTYKLTGCRFDNQGILTYGCVLREGIANGVLATVGLVRISRCGYGFTLAPVRNTAAHQMTGTFRLCG